MDVEWLPFYLYFDTPPEGRDLPEHVKRARANGSEERLRSIAQMYDMPFVSVKRIHNTRVAHEATEYAREHGQGNEYHDRSNRQRNQRQPRVEKEEQRNHDRHDQHLAHQVQGQGHHIGKILRIGCHPADDFAVGRGGKGIKLSGGLYDNDSMKELNEAAIK